MKSWISFVLIVVSVFTWTSEAFEFQHDISDAIVKNTSFHNLVHIFRAYQAAHNADTVFNDPSFCSRRYTMSIYACPQAIGNHMHEFLNGYAFALVTNRTLLWKFCDRKPCRVDFESDCAEVLERFPWIPSYDQFTKEWKARNCSESAEVLNLINPGERHRADEIFMCCGIDDLNKHAVINVGTHEMQEMRGVTHPNALLQNSTKALVSTLFSYGSTFLYGIMFRTAFRFQPHIVKANDDVMQLANLQHLMYATMKHPHHHVSRDHHNGKHTNSHAIVIGVHLRHSGTSADTEHVWDVHAIQCVQQALQQLNHSREVNSHRPCYILLASDRNQSLNYWRESSNVYCTVITSDHAKSHPEWTEHGPFTGETAMKDLELVSRAPDYFIGTLYDTNLLRKLGSTFSLLMAERRASSGYRSSLQRGGRLIPGCVEPIGNRILPKPMYINEQFQCDRGEIPVVCPNIIR